MNLADLKKIGWSYISRPRCHWENKEASRRMRRYMRNETRRKKAELERESAEPSAV